MGNTALEARGDGIKESSYSILAFPAARFPVEYSSFVKAKWKRDLRRGNDYFKLVHPDVFFQAYEKYINHLLNRPNAVLRLAVLTDTPDVVLGFSLIEGDRLHYVFVQGEQRNRGIGRSLVPVPINSISHLTRIGISAWQHALPKAIFNPF